MKKENKKEDQQPEIQDAEIIDEELSDIDKLKKELEEKDKIIEDHKNKLMRALADFDNFKKRNAQERETIVKFSNEMFINALLPVIDNFDRGMETSKKATDPEDIVKGLALIHRQLKDALEKAGVKEIKALGKHFDPHFHEAVMQKDVDDAKQDNIILEEMQKGYMFLDKLIRPSMVVVGKKKA